ncbi:transcriptional activator of comK gene [Evansella caseinilytica]|uniref:Transcriptional activator of comK protein n=1 Tax=Evansella caseinilytica TaxID=1503961 RepID=A0A1H3PJM7_9BACI|nr:BMP family ABC transporter substrate-binding protein [Evansella caseinilytica]SDZ01297.1 transcriptional activator of comK gene [Evansella caseinilytica]
MIHKLKYFGIIIVIFLLGCSQVDKGGVEKAGLLLSHPLDDQGWNSKAYQGILTIQSSLGIDVHVKEEVQTYDQIKKAIEDFHQEDVTLIFGHGSLYADYFMKVKDDYPHIHFVNFNGDVSGNNITSLHFQGYAMGYFAGMLSGAMTKSNQLGVIAAFPHQPEIHGFQDGVSYSNPDAVVHLGYVESWVDEEKALEIYEIFKASGADIFYPAGDGYHVQVVEKIKSDGLFAIGYVEDHIDLGESTILTSTVQHVEKLYEAVAEAYQQGTLETGNLYYDFAESVIALGEFSREVPEDIQLTVEKAIETYIETGKLPHELDGQ